MKSFLTLLVLFLMGMSFAAGSGPNTDKGKTAEDEPSVKEPQNTGKSQGAASNKGKGNQYRLRKGLSEDFEKGMPADLKEKVEALKQEANKKRQIIMQASPEEAETIRFQWRKGSQQKKDAAVAALPLERQGKVRGMLKKMDEEKADKDEEMRKRQNEAKKVRQSLFEPKKEKKSLDLE